MARKSFKANESEKVHVSWATNSDAKQGALVAAVHKHKPRSVAKRFKKGAWTSVVDAVSECFVGELAPDARNVRLRFKSMLDDYNKRQMRAKMASGTKEIALPNDEIMYLLSCEIAQFEGQETEEAAANDEARAKTARVAMASKKEQDTMKALAMAVMPKASRPRTPLSGKRASLGPFETEDEEEDEQQLGGLGNEENDDPSLQYSDDERSDDGAKGFAQSNLPPSSYGKKRNRASGVSPAPTSKRIKLGDGAGDGMEKMMNTLAKAMAAQAAADAARECRERDADAARERREQDRHDREQDRAERDLRLRERELEFKMRGYGEDFA
jgi:hypothetical protein